MTLVNQSTDSTDLITDVEFNMNVRLWDFNPISPKVKTQILLTVSHTFLITQIERNNCEGIKIIHPK